MSDNSIKDIDKLTSLLTEFGIEFNTTNYEYANYIDAVSVDGLYATAFKFTTDGDFLDIVGS